MKLGKYSIGIGDRFGRQGKAQLRALMKAEQDGIAVVPVWNKSHREHTIIGSVPGDVRAEADDAVRQLKWRGQYHVDADHIGLKNVDLFLDASDFFTLDVAECIGNPASVADVQAFVDRHSGRKGSISLPGTGGGFDVTSEIMAETARKFLLAVRKAGEIYRRIESKLGAGNFITEVSMDESSQPQTPEEMFFILAAVADEGIPVQTIAPKFTGRFNKGVDYVGDVDSFRKEFSEDVDVIACAVREFGLPDNLKLSVHSGSDKFSIYPVMRGIIKRSGAGLHLKTAGTTWLEELTGLASAGGEGLSIAREIYRESHGRFDELCAPYASVVDIDRARLPSPDVVDAWSGEEFAAALRHDRSCRAYDVNVRQLLHVGYKVAAEMGCRYLAALDEFEDVISANVTENIYRRHIGRVFGSEASA